MNAADKLKRSSLKQLRRQVGRIQGEYQNVVLVRKREQSAIREENKDRQQINFFRAEQITEKKNNKPQTSLKLIKAGVQRVCKNIHFQFDYIPSKQRAQVVDQIQKLESQPLHHTSYPKSIEVSLNMDQTTPLPLQAYGNISSAAKQQNHFMFSFDQTAVKNMNTVGANTTGKPPLPPFSATGNEKFEWGQELNGGAMPSPNIFQHKGFAYTPIMTGAAYSSLAKGQNYFNFANASSLEEQNTMQQMHNATNTNGPNGGAFGTTPQQIQHLYDNNLNFYGNPAFNSNNIQAAVAANNLIQPQQQNYTAATNANGAMNPLGAPKLNEEAGTPFQMENAFQFGNFNGQGVSSQNNNGKNASSSIIGVGNNSKPGQNGVVQPSQFMPQQQQFPQQQSQQGQQPQQPQQQQQSTQQQHQQQQFQNFQKNQFLNNAFNNFSNQPGDQSFQGEAGLNMNQLQAAAAAANGATNPQQLAAAVATAGNSSERKKPQLQLSLQIPQGNSNNQNTQQTNSNNPNTANPTANTNGHLNTTDGNGFYFQSYNNIGLAPFTPINPTTMGFQSLNGAPPSSHLPPFTQRTGNQQYDNFFFNAQTNMQQIPDQYPLLTPGGNTGYNKQQFFYPAPGSEQPGPSQFMQQQYAAQHPAQTPTNHPNNPQHMQQHTHQFPQSQQQSQQQQQSQFQQHQQQNPQQQQQLMHQQGQGFGIDPLTQQQQQIQGSTEKNNQKKKNLNLKLDVNVKDNNFGIISSFERGSSGDQKKGLLNLNSGILDSASKGGFTSTNDDEKDKNIMSMLQKNNPQNNLTPSSYLDAANMSLIIDFYQKANPEKKQQLYDFLSNQQNDDKDDNQKNKSQKIIEYIITANTKRIGTLTLQQRMEKIQRYREKRQRRANTSLVKYKKQQIAVSKKPRDKNGKFLKQLDEETIIKKKQKKK